MVGHTHQDFLVGICDGNELSVCPQAIDLSSIRDFREERELFDLPGHCFRKVSVSYLDEYLDDLSDWEHFTCPLIGIDRLYILDDRTIINPIMAHYGQDRNRRFLAHLKQVGIPATIVGLPIGINRRK